MPEIKKPVIVRAGLRRVCCDSSPDRPRGNVNGAHWELYLVVYNTTDPWPAHKWPASRRHQIPTIAERRKVLADFGYAPALNAEWEWQEDETSAHHGHAITVCVFATLDILPLEQAPAAQGGDR
ncbi:DUF6303 family protein [Streptomyces sp. NBC_00582]|uniref:DUF6303 family protein n=1 Tax=Streptomyces sp. NBC_00582 TaxID=2975783 RepID=UPI002E806C65|nr:DUF6303 family protein [Streptomyces sp. NBC_00582]WUB64473.1 DUF6303 family protein [Streptomyces sp. NBC_00582]